MKYTKEGKPILWRLSAKSSFKLVFETMCVLGIKYEWNEGHQYPYVLDIRNSEGRGCTAFKDFEDVIERINLVMESMGYIKPIERI